MKIVICICTRHRPDSLERALTSVSACDQDGHEVEMLITVNENDGVSRQMLEKFPFRSPVTIIEEHRPGIAHTRNAALSHLLQHYPPEVLALWTDDDIVVDHNWLKAMAQTAHQYGSQFIYGGRIIPTLSKTSPGIWIKHLLKGKYASPLYADYQPDVRTGQTEKIPFGPNFAFFLASVDDHRFPTHLGLGTHSLGEETEFLRRLMESGHGVIYCHDAAIQHMLRQEQFSEDWIINRAAQWGCTEAIQKMRRFTTEKMATTRRKYRRRLRLHQTAVALLSFSGLLSIDHRIRVSYYRAFLEATEKSGESPE